MNEYAKRHINITLNNYNYSYHGPDKTEKLEVDTYPVELCSDNYFKTEYEVNLHALNKKNNLLCSEQKNAYI